MNLSPGAHLCSDDANARSHTGTLIAVATKQDSMSEQRTDPRRARTRAALVTAAQQLLDEDRTDVSVLEITQLAGIGLGSFYNHFDTKDELFEAAVDDALVRHDALIVKLSLGIEDPAETFARAFRLTGRLHRQVPAMSRVLMHHGAALITSDHGLAPHALRDITAAREAGRFTIDDPELALVVAGGSILALGQLLHTQPERDAAATTDALAVDLLRMFGLSDEDAHEICSRALPDLDELITR